MQEIDRVCCSRDHIQKSLDDAQNWEREAEALARKQAKEVMREERNNRIAMMIAQYELSSNFDFLACKCNLWPSTLR